MCISCAPVRCASISPARCGVPPVPEVPKAKGLALACAISSCSEFAGTEGCATRISVASPSLVTGAKSRKVSNGIFANTWGLITIVPSKPSTRVGPSGALLATCSVPMLPEAPGRFSTTTGWPRRAPSRSATVRALVSVTPPAAKGTTSRTGRDGKARPEPAKGSCAKAAWAATSARTAVSTIDPGTSFSSDGCCGFAQAYNSVRIDEQPPPMLDFAGYVKIFVALLVIVNPIGTMPMFLGLTHRHSVADKKRIARVASISVAVVLTASAVVGEHLLGFFGITISSFRVGGAILILLLAISMMHAATTGGRRTPEDARGAAGTESVPGGL